MYGPLCAQVPSIQRAQGVLGVLCYQPWDVSPRTKSGLSSMDRKDSFDFGEDAMCSVELKTIYRRPPSPMVSRFRRFDGSRVLLQDRRSGQRFEASEGSPQGHPRTHVLSTLCCNQVRLLRERSSSSCFIILAISSGDKATDEVLRPSGEVSIHRGAEFLT